MAEKGRPRLVQEVPVIRPGERVAGGIAAQAHADRPGLDKVARAARITVTAATTQWVAAGGPGVPFAAVTATLVQTGATQGAAGRPLLTCERQSGYCANLVPHGVSMDFRDSAGAIVGGYLDHAATATSPSATGLGRHYATPDERSVPKRAELDRTQITLLCDVAKPPHRPLVRSLPAHRRTKLGVRLARLNPSVEKPLRCSRRMSSGSPASPG